MYFFSFILLLFLSVQHITICNQFWWLTWIFNHFNYTNYQQISDMLTYVTFIPLLNASNFLKGFYVHNNLLILHTLIYILNVTWKVLLIKWFVTGVMLRTLHCMLKNMIVPKICTHEIFNENFVNYIWSSMLFREIWHLSKTSVKKWHRASRKTWNPGICRMMVEFF